MDAILRRFQLLHAGSDLAAVSQAFVELSVVFAQDPYFLLQYLVSLMSRAEFLGLSSNN